MTDEATEETAEDTKPFSSIFPANIRYETNTGEISEIWIKHGRIQFVHDVDPDTGEKKSDAVRIEIIVGDVNKDVVIQRFNKFTDALD